MGASYCADFANVIDYGLKATSFGGLYHRFTTVEYFQRRPKKSLEKII
jgi:hypothetical protein